MSQERTEQRDFFETKEAVGMKIWALDSGIGEIIEMQAPYSYRMHNGIRWESEKIVDQYLDYGGVEGVSLKSIFPMEEAVRQLIGLLNESRSETQVADRAAEMNMWQINRLNATIAGQAEAIREQTGKVQERDDYIAELEKSLGEEAERSRLVNNVLAGNNRNLESRIIERDKRIDELETMYRIALQGGAGYDDLLSKERDKEIERLRAEAKERENELSQLRPAYDKMLESLEYAHEALGEAYDAAPDNSGVEGILFSAYNEVGAALKGAE